MIDPTCLTHGLPKSTHWCVQCVICFKDLKSEADCHRNENGELEDICENCAELEEEMMRRKYQ